MTSAPSSSVCTTMELAHEIMVHFVLRKLILQTRKHSHPVVLDFVWFLVGPFFYFHTLWRAGLPEPSLVAYVISTIISWAGSMASAKRTLVISRHPMLTLLSCSKNASHMILSRKLLKTFGESRYLHADRPAICFEPWQKPRARLGSR